MHGARSATAGASRSVELSEQRVAEEGARRSAAEHVVERLNAELRATKQELDSAQMRGQNLERLLEESRARAALQQPLARRSASPRPRSASPPQLAEDGAAAVRARSSTRSTSPPAVAAALAAAADAVAAVRSRSTSPIEDAVEASGAALEETMAAVEAARAGSP